MVAGGGKPGISLVAARPERSRVRDGSGAHQESGLNGGLRCTTRFDI
jgi:hypothetical protein